MRKLSILLLIVLLSSLAGYLAYREFWMPKDINRYALLPSGPLALMEVDDLVPAWNEVQESGVWGILSEQPDLKKIGEGLIKLDSLTGGGGRMDAWFKSTPLSIAVYPEGRTSFSFLYLTEVPHEDAEKTFDQLLEAYSGMGFSMQTRQYRGQSIEEVRHPKNGDVLSYLRYENYLLLSFNPFLIEEAIRSLDEEIKAPVLDVGWKKEAGPGLIKVWFDGEGLNRARSLFFTPEESPGMFNGSFLGHLDFGDQTLEVKGLLKRTGSTAYWEWLRSPGKEERLSMLSMPYLAHSFSGHFSLDAESQRQREISLNEANPERNRQIESFETEMGFPVHVLEEYLSGAMQFLAVPGRQAGRTDKGLIFQLRPDADVEAGLGQYLPGKDLLIGNTKAWKMERSDFPLLWMGPAFKGFPQTYLAQFGEYMILANSSDALINITEAIENESFIFHENEVPSFVESWTMPIFREQLLTNLNAKWKDVYQSGQGFWNRLSRIRHTIKVGKQVEMEIVLVWDESDTAAGSWSLGLKNSTNLGTPLRDEPVLIRKNDASFSTLVQTNNHQLLNVSFEGSPRWSYDGGAAALSPLSLFPYFGEGPDNIMWVDQASRVHLLENNGQRVPGFPRSLPDMEGTLGLARIIADGRAGDHKIVALSQTGQVGVYDQFLNSLASWRLPLEVSNGAVWLSLISGPEEQPVLVFNSRQGQVFMYELSGQALPGFPLDTKKRLSGPLLGVSSPNGFQLIALSEDGERIHITLDGQLKDRNQFYRPSRDSQFVLVPQQGASGYLIIRLDFSNMTVFSANGKELYTRDIVPGAAYEFQYFYVNPLQSLLVLSDPIQQFSFVYDMEGQLLGQIPVESNGRVAVFSSTPRSFYLLSTLGERLLTFGFSY